MDIETAREYCLSKKAVTECFPFDEYSLVMNVLNKKSGVQGLSKLSSDFRDLEAAANEGNELAIGAIDVFCYRVAKYIGSYVAAMNGVDASHIPQELVRIPIWSAERSLLTLAILELLLITKSMMQLTVMRQ